MRDDEFIIWFCGFFDGEGHIPRKCNVSFLDIAQALNKTRPVRKLFNKIKSNFGGSFLIQRNDGKKHKHAIRWRLKKYQEVINLLEKMLPYLILRKDEALRLIKYLKENRSSRIYVSEEHRKLSYRKIAKLYNCSANAIVHMKKSNRDFFYRRPNGQEVN